MFTGTQKRRNFSKDLPLENRMYYNRNHGGSMILNTYSGSSLLKDRSLNRSIGYPIPRCSSSQSDENFIKKRTSFTPYKAAQQLSTLDNRYLSFNAKIKSLLKSEGIEEDKENVGLSSQGDKNNNDRNRSTLIKRSQNNLKQFLDRGVPNTPYFVQCLKRKSIVSTQTYMHIHNSMMTFKQYLRTVQTLKARTPDPRMPPERQGRKTIVFDMDQTLIHTSQMMVKGYEIKVPFKSMQGKIINGYVSVRPHAKEIIKNLHKYFDIVVFTAGNQCYADPILDYLDPDRLFALRLYRDSCTMVNNQLFVKDLRILGRKLQNVVLVDNAPYSYMMQLSNGIPILNYLKGKDDDQLVKLETYLMGLIEAEDVRVINNVTFKLGEYTKFENYDKLVQDLYGKWL